MSAYIQGGTPFPIGDPDNELPPMDSESGSVEPEGAREAGILTALEQISREIPYQQFAGRVAADALSQYQTLRFASQAPAQEKP